MDFISTSIVTLTQPSGFWETILNSFKGAMGTYISAVILLAVLIRILFTFVEIINKKVSMKNMDLNAKMKPELEAIQKKYGHDQRLLQQKTSELYKKYQFSVMGSCFPMLIMTILNFTVFLTLWNSLQAVSNYNIANQYENMKNVYANVVVLNEDDELKNKITQLNESGIEYSCDVIFEKNELKINFIIKDGETVTYNRTKKEESTLTNQYIYELIQKYVLLPVSPEPPKETVSNETATETPTTPEEPTTPTIEYLDTGFNEFFKVLAEKEVSEYYLDTQEGFMWIKNIYKPESPTSPMFTKSEMVNYLSHFYTKEEAEIEKTQKYEENIFDNIVAGIDTKKLGNNGYYVLTIFAVLTSFLSIWLSNKMMQGKNNIPTGQSKMMYFIMPLIFGLFTFMYTSLFAIYLIIGQVVMIVLTPLTTWVVKKWIEHDAKKKKDNSIIEVDYRRK